MNKICVYTICKNEEQNVLPYLESYKYVDLMVVVDTGSTDRTVELFKSSNLPQLHFYQEIIEPFDFSEARNRCLNYTRKLIGFENLKDWIFMNFDMDEFLVDPKSIEKLRFVNLPPEPAYFLPKQINLESPIYIIGRIHTDNGVIKWKNKIHEALYLPEDNFPPEALVDIEYVHNSKITPEKFSLYENIINNILKEDSNDWWGYDWLLDYISLGYIKKTKAEKEKIFKKALKAAEFHKEAFPHYKFQALLSGIYWNLKNKNKLIEELNLHIEKYSLFKTKTYYYIIGTSLEKENPKEALFYYSELVKLNEEDPLYVKQNGHYSDLFGHIDKAFIYNKMCLISYYTLNDKKSAIKYASLTYKEEPTDFNFDNLMICIEGLDE